MSTALPKVFIVGESGTTGLRLHDRLSSRTDIELLSLPAEKRKDIPTIHEFAEKADLMFLCLPDAASKEIVEAVKDTDIRILDTSTAHRTAAGWVYGFPELSAQHRQAVCTARRIAVPGCHASGFIALVYPLVAQGLLPEDALLTCFSLTGYSGGGKQMIAAYEAPERPALYEAPRQYGLGQHHKHLKEMTSVTGLASAPVFCPVVADFKCGMEMTVPLFASQIKGTAADIAAVYAAAYTGPVVTAVPGGDEEGFLSAAAMAGKDGMTVSVFGNEERILLTARYDNLGKGASGAALECMNLAFGWEETKGLIL